MEKLENIPFWLWLPWWPNLNFVLVDMGQNLDVQISNPNIYICLNMTDINKWPIKFNNQHFNKMYVAIRSPFPCAASSYIEMFVSRWWLFITPSSNMANQCFPISNIVIMFIIDSKPIYTFNWDWWTNTDYSFLIICTIAMHI